MTREDNGDTIARRDSTGKFYIYSRDTGHRWASRDTVEDAWHDFYADVARTWPQYARKETTDDTAVREPIEAVA